MVENKDFNTLEDFSKSLIEAIENCAEQHNQEIRITKTNAIKDNDNSKAAISVSFGSSNIAETIYPEDMYKFYKDIDVSMDKIAETAYLKLYDAHLHAPQVDLNKMGEDACKHLQFKLVNKSLNPEMSKLPHLDVPGDYMAVPIYVINDYGDSRATTLVTENFQKTVLKMTDDELLKAAKINGLKVENFKCESLNSVMAKLMSIDGMPPEMAEILTNEPNLMYVLTSNNTYNGAVAIASPEVLQNLVPDAITKDYPGETEYYIIPSSIHEVLCVPYSVISDPAELHEMCCDVNEHEVEPSEVLGQNILHYSTKTHELNVCNTLAELKTIHENATINKYKKETVAKTIGRGK